MFVVAQVMASKIARSPSLIREEGLEKDQEKTSTATRHSELKDILKNGKQK
jgi:hypothetical protein